MKGRLERDEQKGRLEGKICQSQISLRMEPDGDGDAEGGGSSGFKKLYSGNDWPVVFQSNFLKYGSIL